MAFGTNSGNAGQAALDKFAEMMIERMERMKASDWKKGWIGGASGFAGLPQNVGGRNYSGSNSFFLQLHTVDKGYDLPVYLTFKQAHNLKAHVLKGEKAFPVAYWDMIVKDKYGQKISSDEYRAMSKEEKKDLEVIPFVKSFPVYNVAQTNLAEVQPVRMQKLVEKFKVPELRDTEGMYAHAAIDRMVQVQGWLCPIQADKREDGAFYSPLKDRIVVPMKAQFNIGNTPEEIYRDGMEYYSTLLHEMTHSTMTPERLNREMGGRFGDPKYAKEELVAELTAAMISHSMGFDSKVTDNSAAYLDSWIGALRKEPKFIVSVMADVNQGFGPDSRPCGQAASGSRRTAVPCQERPFHSAGRRRGSPFKNAAIVKTRSGDYAIRASYDGVELGLKKVSKDTAKTYFQLTDLKDKTAFLTMTAHKTYEPELAVMRRTQKTSVGLGL